MQKKQNERFTAETLGTTDIHTHAVGIDMYNLLNERFPTTQSVRDLVDKAEKNNVDNIVVFPIATVLYYDPYHLQNGDFVKGNLEEFPYQITNPALLREAKVFGKDKLLPFMAIHPTEKVDEQINFLNSVAQDIYGLKLHTRTTNTTATDLHETAFIDFARTNNIPILIHTKNVPEFTNAKHVITLAANNSEVRFCIAHLCDFDIDLLGKIPLYDNLFVDTSPFLTLCELAADGDFDQVSSNLVETDYHNPAKCLEDIYNLVSDSLLWGTDEPWTATSDYDGTLLTDFSYDDEVEVLRQLKRNGREDIVSKITKVNTAKFLFG